MTTTATRPAPAAAATVAIGSTGTERRAWVRPLLAVIALLAMYGALSLLDDPRGTLGTDTGGKLATVRAMDDRGALDPDIGYWAEDRDPRGTLHPLWYTRHLGDRWVNVTTLPMPYAAVPLYHLGGERAVVLLPMLGALLAALAARAIARRVSGERAGWPAFWAIGLATPVLVYALDFWEHAIGLAAMLWALLLVLDVVDGRGGVRAAAGAGALIGFAATMRTEALVYGAIAVIVAGAILWRQRAPWRSVVSRAAAAGAAFLTVVLTNQLLERVTLGESLRSGRAAETASAGGADLGRRLEEAVTTVVGLNRFSVRLDWVLGALAAGAVMLGAWRLVRADARDRVLGVVLLGLAALVYLLRFADGWGFVPGLLTASPLAAAGIAIGVTSGRSRAIAVTALGAVPIVWLFQYSGGANPQWGARYLLVSGTLLAVLAVCALVDAPMAARVLVMALAVSVTAAGVAWLSQRSHAVAGAMEQITARRDDVVISREAHLLREGGAFYTPRSRWLTAVGDGDLRRAVAIADAAGADRVAVVQLVEARRPRELGPFERRSTRRLEFLPGLDIAVTLYTRPSV